MGSSKEALAFACGILRCETWLLRYRRQQALDNPITLEQAIRYYERQHEPR